MEFAHETVVFVVEPQFTQDEGHDTSIVVIGLDNWVIRIPTALCVHILNILISLDAHGVINT
jgi:hypothetical protein